jgi:type II secretory pathway component PulC
MMLSSRLAIAMTLVVFMGAVELSRRVAEAEHTEQRTLQRQQLEAMQALVEEVQRLRTVLEARTPGSQAPE